MNELALFAGAGGGILGGKLLGWKTVCAVELNAYCASILVARQNDGNLGHFPIWDDANTFDGTRWRGVVDVVSGGYPCQGFSTAPRGRQCAEDLWPQMLRIIREVEAPFVFVENVAEKPIERSAKELSDLGYKVSCGQASAASVGAPHDRPRWWAIAHAHGKSEPRRAQHEEVARIRAVPALAWKEDNSSYLGMVDGMAHRMDRLKAIGNGQVPALAALTWGL